MVLLSCPITCPVHVHFLRFESTKVSLLVHSCFEQLHLKSSVAIIYYSIIRNY